MSEIENTLRNEQQNTKSEKQENCRKLKICLRAFWICHFAASLLVLWGVAVLAFPERTCCGTILPCAMILVGFLLLVAVTVPLGQMIQARRSAALLIHRIGVELQDSIVRAGHESNTKRVENVLLVARSIILALQSSYSDVGRYRDLKDLKEMFSFEKPDSSNNPNPSDKPDKPEPKQDASGDSKDEELGQGSREGNK